MILTIKCPICQHQIVVGNQNKLYDDSTKQLDIDRHMRSHTLGELLEFMELSFAEQLNVLEDKIKHPEAKP